MPAVLAILSAVLQSGFEQTVQWKYGAAGLIGLLLFTIGIKARNSAVASVGAVLLTCVVAGPAL
ncbi:hypothetical protein [Streptomyces mangrovisoli]|uniref:Uncharacterized protein n=1 Tax=Streptomyces mangrovisoli TaxID=1428628 RepID=A0A1J4NQV7_9ACTN|nr:hypothetical protein [Streptomyces mangrovisoli]OIJ64825.1 hypothetical protein WN71_026910 [Streptomyces mangrovisoli]